MVTKIRKRDGSVVFFQKDKIANAIWKAAKSVGGHDQKKAEHVADLVIKRLEESYGENGIPNVEDIQDLVEKTLIKEGHDQTAKAYILYRKSREDLRNVKGLFDTIEAVEDYIGLNDWMVKENSNMGYSLQGLNNYIATKIITNYWMRRIYPEAIRNAHENGDIHVHDLGTLGAYCFDDKTRILTENGWKFFKDVKENEKVATKNLDTGELEFQIPYAKQTYKYSGNMYSFEARGVSLLVTPEHRLLVRRKHKKDWEFVNPPEFKYGMEFDKCVLWKGEKGKDIIIEEVKGGNRKKVLDKMKIQDYVEFMGWYISEGSADEPTKGDYRISIAQSEKKYKGEIINLLEKMKLKNNSKSEFNIVLHSKDLFYHVKKLGISKDKYIPSNIKNLEPELIRRFLIALFKGDGSFYNGKLRRYYTRSEKLAEDVVECLIKIGLCGTLWKRKDNGMYIVDVETQHLTPIYRKKVIKKKYNGLVYDFSVKNGTLVVMRDGKVVVSGNCVGWDLKDLLMVGFKGVKGKVESKPAKHLRTALGQMVNFFYTLQGETAGAQAFSNFDSLLAPFIRYDNLNYKEVKQIMQEFLFNLAVPTRVGFQCMSEDTKILTPDGWKDYSELKEGDTIKTFNITKKVIEEKPIKHLFARHYDGIMYNLKNRIQNQLISPKHRIVRKKFQTNEYVLEEVEKAESMKSPFIVPIAADNSTEDINLHDDTIKLLAWIIAEGSIEKYSSHRHSKRISIYQSEIKNPTKYREIIELLNRSNLHYSESNSTPALGQSVKMIRLNAESSRRIHPLFGVNNCINFIPNMLLNMSGRQSALFLETYLKADGFEGCKITTTNEKILTGLQQIAVNAGYGFSVLKRKPTIGTKPLFVLRLIKHKDTYIQRIEKVNYSGIIWCPNTDNETVIAKRKEKVFITGNTPFTNITMDLKVPSYLADEPVIIGGQPQKESYKEFQKEMDMINQSFAECMLEGDATGQVFTFPIPTYNITKDFEWENPNYDLIWEMTAKYGIPYFSNFINSDMDPEDARSMCCRLRLDQNELKKRGGGLFGANPQTGSLGVVTLNMPRIGFTAIDEEDFLKKVEGLMELSKESLEIKRKTIEKFTELGLYPYSKFYLRQVFQRFGQFWKNHFATIGLLGMNEAIMNFMPGENIATEKGKAFALKVLDFMRAKLEEYQKETGNIYNLEATPGEGTTYRFARIDKKRYGRILVANEPSLKEGAKPYYTNCVSEDTECLTSEGWKKYNELKVNEKILTLNTNTKKLEYQPILYLNLQKLTNADMYNINSMRQDQLVTPNHKVLYDGDRKKKYQFSTPENLPFRIIIPSGGNYQPQEIKEVSDDFIKLIGWIITEGHFEKDNNSIRITQAEWCNKVKFDEIKKILDNLKLKYSILGDKRGRSFFRISASDGKEIRKHISSKTIPRWCLNNLPQKQQKILIETMMKGDGSISKHSSYYSTGNRLLADEFQELCIKNDKRAIICDFKDKCGAYHIVPSVHSHTEITKKNVNKVKYSGTVWCPTVENGTWIARRNNKPFITGNSTHLPVNYTDDLFEALELQDELQTKYSGGTVMHAFVGERLNKNAIKTVVRKIAENFKLPYYTITPTFSICPKHGYISGEHEYCPKCDDEIASEKEGVLEIQPNILEKEKGGENGKN